MFLLVYARLYAKCLGAAFQGVAKNPWTLALPMALIAGFTFIAPLFAPLGMVGGLLLGLIYDALVSCYLYFTAGTVALQKMTLGELKKSFLVYFWSVMGLFFVFWVVNLFIGPALGPRGMLALNAVAFIALNPAPEVIYSKGTRGGIDTITTCMKFLGEAWIEWFIPNLLVAGAAWLVVTRLFPLMPLHIDVLISLLSGALFHIVMLFRGHLFQELDGSSHRQRMFKYRNASS
ncbi:MAG: hypothetical protein JNK82_36840 [Myxococcaceae bacterium]|nr:hypothetical protein [Myxococcaceae bacterium]